MFLVYSSIKIIQFGHIHNRYDGSGNYFNRGIYQEHSDGPRFINASCVDLHHKIQPGNIITEIEIP